MTAEKDYIQHTKTCEEALIACALLDPQRAVTEVLSIVMPEDFRDEDFGNVYRTISELHQAGIRADSDSVITQLAKKGITAEITPEKLGQIVQRHTVSSSHTIDNAAYYAAEVARLASQRRDMEVAKSFLSQEFRLDRDRTKELERFEAATKAERLAGSGDSVKISKAFCDTAARHASRPKDEGPGIATGFPDLDSAIGGGLHKSTLVYLGARLGIGKTALALAIAASVTSRGKKVLFSSLEMTANELAERLASDQLGIPFRRFSNGELETEDLDAITACASELEDWELEIADRSNQSIDYIRARASVMGNVDLIVIDNLQILAPVDARVERRHQLTALAQKCKSLAKDLDCCVLLVGQLNADAEGRAPTKRDLSEGKQVLEPVHTAMLLHREREGDGRLSRRLEVHVSKARSAEECVVELDFDGAYQRISDRSVCSELG